MRNRIWNELGESQYYLEFLKRYIARAQRWNGIVKALTTIITFGSIAGWYRFSDLSIVWAVLIVLVQLFNLFKDFFLVSESELSTLRAVLNFYNRHCRDLENLWFDFHDERITDEQTRKRLGTLIKKELDMLELEKHDLLTGTKKQKGNADVATREYLAKITRE